MASIPVSISTSSPNTKPWNVYHLLNEKFPRFTAKFQTVKQEIKLGLISENKLDRLFLNDGDFEDTSIPSLNNPQESATSQRIRDLQAQGRKKQAHEAKEYFEKLKQTSNDELHQILSELAKQRQARLDESNAKNLGIVQANEDTFEYWSKFTSWTAQQAADLLHGTNPETTHKARNKNSYLSKEWKKTEALIKDNFSRIATIKGEKQKSDASTNFKPDCVLAWAKQMEIQIPEGLSSAVARFHPEALSSDIQKEHDFQGYKCAQIPTDNLETHWRIQTAIHWIATKHQSECEQHEFETAAKQLLSKLEMNSDDFKVMGIPESGELSEIGNFWGSVSLMADTLEALLNEDSNILNPYTGTLRLCADGGEFLKIRLSAEATKKHFPQSKPNNVIPTSNHGKIENRGRKTVAEWDDVADKLQKKIDKDGFPDEKNIPGWDKQADAENWVADFLSKKDIHPSPTTIRRHTKEILENIRSKKEVH